MNRREADDPTLYIPEDLVRLAKITDHEVTMQETSSHRPG
jgi:hypothetical protein